MKSNRQAAVHHVHFTGICGSAMGNAAIGLKRRGFRVTGSDGHVYPPMSDLLASYDIEIGPFSAESVLSADLTVIGNAIARGNPEAEAVLNQSRPFCSLPELIRDFFLEHRKLILVTGTHGKTTTSALIAHILQHGDMNPSFLIGGVPAGWSSGFHWHPDSEWMVLEGDEYDTAFFDKTAKFLKFFPDVLIINALEFDHGDIYRDMEDLRRAFRFLLRRTPERATVIARGDDPEVAALEADCRSRWKPFRCDGASGNQIVELGVTGERVTVSARLEEEAFSWSWALPGLHNACNGLAAALAAQVVGVAPEAIKDGLESFPGVKRRFQVRADKGGVLLVEDFAHHPTAVRETISACRSRYPGRRVMVFFEPATNTLRSGMLWDDLVAALRLADGAVLLPIPLHRRHGISGGVTDSGWDVPSGLRRMRTGEPLPPILNDMIRPGDVLLFMSNADFQGYLDEAMRWLEETHG